MNYPASVHDPATPAAGTSLAERIADELSDMIARRQRALARSWCSRALSMTHLHLLLLLQAEGPLAMSRLAGALDVSVSSATGIVDRMAERGLIERERDERDRRLVLVRLAPAGQAAVEEADLVRRQHLVDVMRRLSPRQQQDVLQALHDLRSVLDTGLPESTTPGEGR